MKLKAYAGRKLFLDLPRALIEGHPRPKRPYLSEAEARKLAYEV